MAWCQRFCIVDSAVLLWIFWYFCYVYYAMSSVVYIQALKCNLKVQFTRPLLASSRFHPLLLRVHWPRPLQTDQMGGGKETKRILSLSALPNIAIDRMQNVFPICSFVQNQWHLAFKWISWKHFKFFHIGVLNFQAFSNICFNCPAGKLPFFSLSLSLFPRIPYFPLSHLQYFLRLRFKISKDICFGRVPSCLLCFACP